MNVRAPPEAVRRTIRLMLIGGQIVPRNFLWSAACHMATDPEHGARLIHVGDIEMTGWPDYGPLRAEFIADLPRPGRGPVRAIGQKSPSPPQVGQRLDLVPKHPSHRPNCGLPCPSAPRRTWPDPPQIVHAACPDPRQRWQRRLTCCAALIRAARLALCSTCAVIVVSRGAAAVYTEKAVK